jgi:hypothetical protein
MIVILLISNIISGCVFYRFGYMSAIFHYRQEVLDELYAKHNAEIAVAERIVSENKALQCAKTNRQPSDFQAREVL